jgi:hypothetical protein
VTDETTRLYNRSAAIQRVRRNAAQILLPAGLALVLGWVFLGLPESVGTVPLYVLAILVWTLRIGGIALLGVAAICRTGRPIGLLLDAIISSWFALALAAATVCLLAYNATDLNGYVFAVLALVYMRAAWALWKDYPAVARAAAPEEDELATSDSSETSRWSSSPPETADEQPRSPNEPAPVSADAIPPSAPDALEPADEAPPGGFLSGFAERKNPPSEPNLSGGSPTER